jgi:hypothetical protein
MCACGGQGLRMGVWECRHFSLVPTAAGFPSAHTHERDFREFLCDSVLYEEEEGSFTCLAA